MKTIALGVVALLGIGLHGFGCGISWSVPFSRFDGVDERGYVSYSQKIDDVDFGDGLKLPLIIDFSSVREGSSPYLGRGWILALLDSSFIQTGEGSFQMVQPDGWVRPFLRDGSDRSILNGGPDWKAQIKGDTITAWAGCGWKLIYSKGRLTGIGTPKDRHLELIYSGGKVIELRERGAVKLTVEFDEAKGMARSLAYNGKRVQIAQAPRPRVQVIGGQNVIGGMDQSLSALLGAPGEVDRFEFAVNDKVQPTLKITQNLFPSRLFVWDAATKLIAADSDWIYEITSAKVPSENAAIKRRNSLGQSEYWHYDFGKGRMIETALDGTTLVTSYFISGKMAGRKRSVERICNGKADILYTASCDEEGRLLRERVDNSITTYTYHPNGSRDTKTIKVADKILFQERFRPSRKLLSVFKDDVLVECNDAGLPIEMKRHGKPLYIFRYLDGNLVAITRADDSRNSQPH